MFVSKTSNLDPHLWLKNNKFNFIISYALFLSNNAANVGLETESLVLKRFGPFSLG